MSGLRKALLRRSCTKDHYIPAFLLLYFLLLNLCFSHRAIMNASFESLCSPQSFPMHAPEQQASRPNFLSAIKNLQQSLKKPLRSKPRNDYETSQTSKSSSDVSSGSSRTNSQHVPCDYYEAPRRQGIAPDMDDYLSLDQLEGLWQYQDSYIGPVATPLTSSCFNYQEAVEAPTFVQHKRPDNASIPRGNSVSNLGVTGSDEALVVDGHLHPAMRSAPNLHETIEVEAERDLPPPPVSVADLPAPPPPAPVNRARIDTDFPRLSAIGKPLVSKSGKPISSRMGKPVPVPAERPNTSWTQRRQLLREEPGLI